MTLASAMFHVIYCMHQVLGDRSTPLNVGLPHAHPIIVIRVPWIGSRS